MSSYADLAEEVGTWVGAGGLVSYVLAHATHCVKLVKALHSAVRAVDPTVDSQLSTGASDLETRLGSVLISAGEHLVDQGKNLTTSTTRPPGMAVGVPPMPSAVPTEPKQP